jgi:hypothetical protein
MMQPIKAALMVDWGTGPPERIPVQFNPTEMAFSKNAHYAEVQIPGLDAPIMQFVRGEAETITLDLFFDSTEDGTGPGAKSVVKDTDKMYQLAKVLPHLHAPPICTLVWSHGNFPGSQVSVQLGNNRRTSFQCVVESVRHKYTLFSPLGDPLRATVTLGLKEYRTVDQQFAQLNLNSPDRTQVHVLEQGETLGGIAAGQYFDPAQWRLIADSNGLDDPRRLTPGMFLSLPPSS